MENQMNKIFLGLDVSKGYADLTVIDDNGKIITPSLRLPDNNSGYISLLKLVSDLKTDPNTLCYAGMESTGGFETHWFNLLSKRSDLFYNVFIFNGYCTKHYQKALSERNKTDAVSSRVIAQFIRNNHENMANSHSHLYHKYKKILYTIKTEDKRKTQNINQLRQVLYEYFPEFSSIMPDKFSNCHLLFLINLPSRQSVLEAENTSLMKIPYIKQSFVDKLVKLCKDTVLSAQPDDEYSNILIPKLATEIMNYNKNIAQFTEILTKAIPKEQIELLCSIPGLGVRSAIALLILIGDINNFESGKNLASYFGVHPITNNSGNVEKSRMSKQGNPYARQILYHIVFQMFKKKSFFNPYLETVVLKFNGKKMKAVGLMMHKVCHIIFSMLTYNTKFDCERFKQDRNRKNQSKPQKSNDIQDFFKNNNLKPEDWEAPLSNSKRKQIYKTIKREPQNSKESSAGSSRPSSDSNLVKRE